LNRGIENRMQLRRTLKYPKNKMIIASVDTELAAQYTTIALFEYQRKNFENSGVAGNFYGLIGELCIYECLVQEGFKQFEYISRKLNYWDSKDTRPYDFKVNGKTLEAVTVMPNHRFCLIKESSWKRSDFAVCVQIKNMECETEIYDGKTYKYYRFSAEEKYPTEITRPTRLGSHDKVGEAVVVGYGTLDEILNLKNGWCYGKPPNKPTTQYPARYIELDKMHGINELWDLLKKHKLQNNRQKKLNSAFFFALT